MIEQNVSNAKENVETANQELVKVATLPALDDGVSLC
jgi:hypothetical protein